MFLQKCFKRRRTRQGRVLNGEKRSSKSSDSSILPDTKEDTAPSFQLENRDISESPVPDIPIATPEVSDDEESAGSRSKLGVGQIKGTSLVSIDRDVDDAIETDKLTKNEKNVRSSDKQTMNSDNIKQDASLHKSKPEAMTEKRSRNNGNTDVDSILPFIPAVPKSRGHEFPSYWGSIKQLYCRTGYHLAICPNGKVEGVLDEYNPYAILEFRSPAVGEVWIRGKTTGLYLTMNKKGRLYGQPQVCHEGALFLETYKKGYNRYLSKLYQRKKWYVGVKKSGKAKSGPKTRKGQKAVQFLPRATKPSI